MPRAFTAEDFEVGARALVDRWSIDPAAMHESMTVRWVEETDPLRRNAAAGGYVAAEGHLVVDEGEARPHPVELLEERATWVHRGTQGVANLGRAAWAVWAARVCWATLRPERARPGS